MSHEIAAPVEAEGAESPGRAGPPGGFLLRLRRRPFLVLVLAAVVALLAAGGCAAWSYYAVRESTDDAQIDAHVNPVAARVGGTVIKVNVGDNQYVAAGTLLVQIDPRDYEVALQHAEANLANAEAAARAAATRVPVTSTTSRSQIDTARAALQQTEAGAVSAGREVEVARARLASAQAQARQAEANYRKAAQDLERMKTLVEKDEISRQQYDAVVAAAEAASGQRDSADGGDPRG